MDMLLIPYCCIWVPEWCCKCGVLIPHEPLTCVLPDPLCIVRYEVVAFHTCISSGTLLGEELGNDMGNDRGMHKAKPLVFERKPGINLLGSTATQANVDLAIAVSFTCGKSESTGRGRPTTGSKR